MTVKHWIKWRVVSLFTSQMNVNAGWFLEGHRSPGQAAPAARTPAPYLWKRGIRLAVWLGIGRGGRDSPVWVIHLRRAQWREIMQSSESHFKLLLWWEGMRGLLCDTKTNDQQAVECERKIGEPKGEAVWILSKSIIHYCSWLQTRRRRLWVFCTD